MVKAMDKNYDGEQYVTFVTKKNIKQQKIYYGHPKHIEYCEGEHQEKFYRNNEIL